MADAAGETWETPLRVTVDRRLTLESHGAKNTSAGGLLADLSDTWIDRVHERRPPHGIMAKRRALSGSGAVAGHAWAAEQAAQPLHGAPERHPVAAA